MTPKEILTTITGTLIASIAIISIMLMLTSLAAATNSETEQIVIDQLKEDIKLAGESWTPGITSVSHFSPKDKLAFGTQGSQPEPNKKIMRAPMMSTSEYIPGLVEFDLRDEGMVSPVKSQGSCGSCWAFSATGAVESMILKEIGIIEDLSEQHLISTYCNAGSCDGGWTDWALGYIKHTGIPLESCYPNRYEDSGKEACVGWESQAYRIIDYVCIGNSEDDFKWALQTHGPLCVVLCAPSDWYYYRSGIYSPVTNLGWANHAVLLTGWDDTDGCWFIKNSWGKNWGEQGYARVKYGDLEKYNYAYAVTGLIYNDGSGDVIPDPDTLPTVGWMKPVNATATTEYNHIYTADKAIDNNTNTHWFSKRNALNPSITFDLGCQVTISKIRAHFYPDDLPSTIDIETSGGSEIWTPVITSYNDTPITTIAFSAHECRYVRLTTVDAARYYGTCSEFDVWVEADPEPDPDPDPMPDPPKTWKLELTYADRTEVIYIHEDVLHIQLALENI